MTEVATLKTAKKTSKIGGLFIASCLSPLVKMDTIPKLFYKQSRIHAILLKLL